MKYVVDVLLLVLHCCVYFFDSHATSHFSLLVSRSILSLSYWYSCSHWSILGLETTACGELRWNHL